MARLPACPNLTRVDAKAQKSARTGRRRVLKLGAAGILAWTMPVPGAVARGVPPPVPVGRGLYLVNGWLLTEADLARIGLDDL